jgi:hypothetical protein
MAGYSEGSTTSDSQTFESNVTFTRQRSARLQLLHKSLTASVLQSGIYGQKGARPIPNGPGQPQLVDDCENKRYMINFLDESRGGQD